MPLSYPAGHRGRAPGLPHRRRGLRREPPRDAAGGGPGAFDRLQSTLTNDLRKIAPGRAQYTHLLDDDGSVVDDLIVWWVSEERFDVMPNASNTGPARGRSRRRGRDRPRGRSWPSRGRRPAQRLAKVAPAAAAVGRFASPPSTWEGADCLAAGTGYTGEDGVECAVPRRGGRRVLRGRAGRGRDAGRSRCPRHLAPRGRPAAPRPRARARGSPRSRPGSAGWWAGTRGSSGGERPSRPSAARPAPAAARTARRRPPAAAPGRRGGGRWCAASGW